MFNHIIICTIQLSIKSNTFNGFAYVENYTLVDYQLFNYLWQLNGGQYYLKYATTGSQVIKYYLCLDSGVTVNASWAPLTGFTVNQQILSEYTAVVGTPFTPSTVGNIVEVTAAPNASIVYSGPNFGAGIASMQEIYTPPTPFVIPESILIQSQSGSVREVNIPVAPNIIVTETALIGATTGTVREVELPVAPNIIVVPTGSLAGATTGSIKEIEPPVAPNIIVVPTGSLTPSTTGVVEELNIPVGPNIIVTRETPVAADQGTLTIAEDELNRHRIASVNIPLYGNTTYMQRTGESTYVNSAEIVDGGYWPAGGTSAVSGQSPGVIINTDTNGYVTGSVFNSQFPGAFSTSEDIMFKLQTTPDTYTPPVLTPAELADVWDTDDEWTTTGEDDRKVWPTVVTPTSAKITLNTPSISAASQNGIKFTRGAGFTKWRLEVDYPPMKADKFREFHAIAQAAQGQVVPFYFKLRNADGNNILWADFGKAGTTNAPILKEPVNASDTTMLLEGFQSFETDAFRTGEVFIDGANDNGALHTVVNTVDANAFGEAKIRTAMPVRQAQPVATTYNKDPEWAVVTLSNDDFEYTVDTAGFYYMSVAFDLDGWK